MPSQFSSLTNDLSLLTSETLEIIAESGKKHFYVHSDILVAHSTPQMSDISEKKINFSNWDGDTVGWFVQFLYVGDYQVPEPITDEEDMDEDTRRGGMDTPDTVESLADREELRPKETNVLLIHAKVYMLAQDNSAEALRKIAFERLKTALGGIDRSTLKGRSKAVSNVIDLLGYVYSRRDTSGSMRELVSKFAAENIEMLVGRRGMASLLSKGGDFTVELMAEVSGRIYDIGKDVQVWKDQVIASEENARQSEAISLEKVQQLDAKVREMETNIQRAGAAARMEKLREKEIQKFWELEAKVKELEAKIQGFDTKIQNVEANSASKVDLLESRVKQRFSINGWAWPF